MKLEARESLLHSELRGTERAVTKRRAITYSLSELEFALQIAIYQKVFELFRNGSGMQTKLQV